jgi:hypothetical protein
MKFLTRLCETLGAPWRWIVLAVCLLALSACGDGYPGSGGTGTGPLHLFAALNASQGNVPPSLVLPVSPTGDINNCYPAHLELTADLAQLDTPCAKFSFQGAWTLDENHQAFLTGTAQLLVDGAWTNQSAILRLIADGPLDRATSIQITVLDPIDRHVLMGPITLWP